MPVWYLWFYHGCECTLYPSGGQVINITLACAHALIWRAPTAIFIVFSAFRFFDVCFERLCSLYSAFIRHSIALLPITRSSSELINILRQRQNGRHFADYTFNRIFVNETFRISIRFSLKFVPKGPNNNIPALVQIMAWRRPGDKPLSEPVMVSLLTHICVTRSQWVKAEWRICATVKQSSLVPIMAGRLVGAKPSFVPMLNIVNWTLGNKLQWNFNRNQ